MMHRRGTIKEMYKFAVCDDEQADAAYVEKLLDAWGRARGYEMETTVFPSAESFLFAYEEQKDFDVLLLDIEMGEMSGIELAGRVRERDRSVQIVFITGYMEYIAQGYDVEALHYLLKPVTADKFAAVLDRAVRHIGARERALLLQMAEETVRVPLCEIRWLEVRKNYVTVHGEAAYSIKRTLRSIEEELDERFFRPHRSFVVNMEYVKRITKTEAVLKDGTGVPLTRGMYDKMNRAFIRYFSEGQDAFTG